MAEASLLDTFIRYGLPAILGSTVIAALVKLWQERRAARRDLIADWRENLVPLLDEPISLGGPKAKYPCAINPMQAFGSISSPIW